MQKVQKGGGGVVVTVVIVSVDDEYDARSSLLAHAVKQWRASADDNGPRVRILLHQVKDDTCVVGVLTAAVLPKLNGPVVIMRGNTTAILNTDVRTWIDRWMESDVPVWCTAMDVTSAIQRWWYDTILGSTTSGNGKPSGRDLVPVWGAFSGISSALQTVLVPYAGSGCDMNTVLQHLVDDGRVYLDATPLVHIGMCRPPCTQNGNVMKNKYVPPPAWSRFAWTATRAVQTRDGKIITATVGLVAVLLCVILGLSVAVATRKRYPIP